MLGARAPNAILRGAGKRPRDKNEPAIRGGVMASIRHPKDFWSGVLFAAIGVFALVYGSRYTLGTAARMGPGYFPRILGILLFVLGVVLVLRSLSAANAGSPIPRWKLRPTLLVIGGVILFGYIVQWLGMVLSTVILIVCTSAASHEFRPKEAVISGILLAALATGVFVIGIGVQLPIWPFQR
jgi:hypothetical protein